MPSRSDTRSAAVRLMALRPAEVGRLCGFTRLTDGLHGGWMRRMILGREDLTILAHRGSFKTTCLTVAIASLMALRPEKNILFLRKTEADVTEVIRQVKGLLEGPVFAELTALVWGAPVRLARATAFELHTDLCRGPRGAVQLLGQGIGGSLTGKHADILFTDDIVNLSDRLSQAEREHTRAVYRELQNIRNPGGRIINTGTPWHPEDAVALMGEPLRCDCYSTGLLSAAQLERLRRAMTPSLFAANYELRHIAEQDALFPETPPFTEDERLLWDGIAHVDASYGGGDATAFTCGRRAGGRFVLYGRLWEGHVDAHIGEIAAECRRLRCAPVYCEVNGDKGYLARAIRAAGVPVRPYTESMNKYVKIAAHLRSVWPEVTLLRGTDPAWLRQILAYSEQARHDDAPDSAASLIRRLTRGAAA